MSVQKRGKPILKKYLLMQAFIVYASPTPLVHVTFS